MASGDDGPEAARPEMTAALVSEHRLGRQFSILSPWRVPQERCIPVRTDASVSHERFEDDPNMIQVLADHRAVRAVTRDLTVASRGEDVCDSWYNCVSRCLTSGDTCKEFPS